MFREVELYGLKVKKLLTSQEELPKFQKPKLIIFLDFSKEIYKQIFLKTA